MEVFPFVRYTESSSLEISAEEVWNNLRCATKWEIFRKGLRRIWLASMCGEIYHDTPSWTWFSTHSSSSTQAQYETLSHVTWLGTNSKQFIPFKIQYLVGTLARQYLPWLERNFVFTIEIEEPECHVKLQGMYASGSCCKSQKGECMIVLAGRCSAPSQIDARGLMHVTLPPRFKVTSPHTHNKSN
jgi:hypothetical protein